MKRRTILKTVGAGAIGAGVMSGTVAAQEGGSAIDEIRFCGCSQVCVDSGAPKDIYIAWETENGWDCTRPNSGKIGLGTTFCFELTDETREELGVPEDAKIIGIEDKTRIFCNPHECARRGQEWLASQDDNPCAQGLFSCENPEDFGIEVGDCKGLGQWKKERGIEDD